MDITIDFILARREICWMLEGKLDPLDIGYVASCDPPTLDALADVLARYLPSPACMT